MGWRTKVKRREMNVVGRLCGQTKTFEVAIKRLKDENRDGI
ncbi:MAG: hypothetical protein QGF12_08800 [SAR202 cluster bacterium]|jgi:hypothetical protein|nr:hypothetical protein [SAR202 cluster bacterium]